MLSESYRILVPGGKIRIATPNLLVFVDLFRSDQSEAAQKFVAGKLEWHGWPTHHNVATTILNLQLSWWGHQYVYDPETLKGALTSVGFEDIREFGVGESQDPDLQNVEGRQGRDFEALNAYGMRVW